MDTFDSLLAVFIVRKEHVEALATLIADKVVGWHTVILLESGNSVEVDRAIGNYKNVVFEVIKYPRPPVLSRKRRKHGKRLP